MAKKAKKRKPAKKVRRRSKKAPTAARTIYKTKHKPESSMPRSGGPSVPPLSDDQLQKFRDVLVQKRDDLLTIVQRKKEQEVEDMDVGDEADIATRSVEKEMLFELTDSEKQTLDKIEAALRKMEKGVFGFCESCRKGIPRMRLNVMPWARYCVNCQSELEIPSGE